MALFKTFRGQRKDLDNVNKVDGYAYFCTDDGSFWIDHLEGEEIVRTQINKADWTKDIQEAVADWNQTDPTATDYIKNKPFGTEIVSKQIVDEEYTTESLEDFGGAFGKVLFYSESLDEIPATINVVFDGNTYSDLVVQETPIGMATGNLSKLNMLIGENVYEDTGEPFVIGLAYDYCVVASDMLQSSTHNLQALASIKEVRKLDPKYFSVADDMDFDSLRENFYQYVSNVGNGDVIVAKANRDSEGNVIAEIYATKNELETAREELSTVNNEVRATTNEVRGEMLIVTFNIVPTSFRVINLQLSAIKVDWGDGTIDDKSTHTYANVGEYVCKIYGVTSIGEYAFKSCGSLTSVVIGNGVTSIDYMAFSSCNSLTSVVIPDSVTRIAGWAFDGCNSLTSITFTNLTPITYSSNIFTGCPALTTIYVPYDCKQAYIDRWTADGAPAEIIALISESDREAMMSDVNALNIQKGTNNGAVQQVADNCADGFDFTNKNPNATKLDTSLTGILPYGAVGNYASAFGGKSSAQGKRSHAEGTTTIAKANYSHAEGDNSVTLGADSHAEGYATVTGPNAQAGHAEGINTQALGRASHAEGQDTIAYGQDSHTEGSNTATVLKDEQGNVIAVGEAAHAEGGYTKAVGKYSHTEGYISQASAEAAHAEGKNTIATGECAHAEGDATEASGWGAHAEGTDTHATRYCAHAEGKSTTAKGNHSHAEGDTTIAEGESSHAGGTGAHAKGSYSFAHGNMIVAGYANQFVVGQFNSNKEGNLFEVGNGSNDHAPSNAFEVLKDGRAKSYGVPLEDNDLVTVAFMKQYIRDNFAALMKEYLTSNKPTVEEIAAIFNEEA